MQKSIIGIGLIYGTTAACFFLIDLIWIGFVARSFYAETLGGLLRESINWPAAIAFYLIYTGGIVLFVIVPALDHGAGFCRIALTGGLLGLCAYGTFDLTALALLEGWPVVTTVVDMTWGTFLTAATASATLWVAKNFMKRYGRQVKPDNGS